MGLAPDACLSLECRCWRLPKASEMDLVPASAGHMSQRGQWSGVLVETFSRHSNEEGILLGHSPPLSSHDCPQPVSQALAGKLSILP